MRTFAMVALLLALSVFHAVCAENDEIKKGDENTKLSYILGRNLGADAARAGIETNEKVLVKGILDALNNRESVLSEEEVQATIEAFQKRMQSMSRDEQIKKMIDTARKRVETNPEQKAIAEKNIAEGNKFREENKKREGVKVTESGLQYEVLKQGDGPKPTREKAVLAHYRGTLVNGKEFDSSYKRGEPTEFGVAQVIPGWTEALLLMNTGSKLRIVVPPELGYHWQGAGPDIGPMATLVFEMELVEVK